MSRVQLDLISLCMELSDGLPVPKLFTSDTEVIESDFKASAQTSIFRKSASVPLRVLLEENLIQGSVLNFGKGKWDTDSACIRAVTGNCQDYDYTWAPTDIVGRHFSCVYAGYVLNTLPWRSRQVVWKKIADATDTKNGTAFIAVRSDKDKGIRGTNFEDGVITSRNTFQIGFSEAQILNEASCFFSSCRVLCNKQNFILVSCRHR